MQHLGSGCGALGQHALLPARRSARREPGLALVTIAQVHERTARRWPPRPHREAKDLHIASRAAIQQSSDRMWVHLEWHRQPGSNSVRATGSPDIAQRCCCAEGHVLKENIASWWQYASRTRKSSSSVSSGWKAEMTRCGKTLPSQHQQRLCFVAWSMCIQQQSAVCMQHVLQSQHHLWHVLACSRNVAMCMNSTHSLKRCALPAGTGRRCA